jgi:hypothetical protein
VPSIPLALKSLKGRRFDDVEIPNVRFEVLEAVNMVITVFWDVGPCSLIALYQIASHHFPKDSNLHFCNKGSLELLLAPIGTVKQACVC